MNKLDRIDNLKMLYDKLSTLESINLKTMFDGKEIIVTLHEEYIIKIILKYGFYFYINNVFYYDIEGDDLWESFHELINDDTVLVETTNLIKRKKVKTMTRKDYDSKKDKLMAKSNIKIFTPTELLYKSKDYI